MRKLLLKLILFGGIVFALLLTYIFGFTNGTKFTKANAVPESQQSRLVDENELWTIANNWREEQGKTAYTINPILCGFADQRVDEIQTDFSHKGYLLISENKIHKAGGFYRTGENIARDFFNANDVFRSWLSSPTHRENLDENFTESCIRCENNYCVQLFGK